VWTLLPFSLVLALLQLAVWWPMAGLVQARRAPIREPEGTESLA
jgi:hypothetical protein